MTKRNVLLILLLVYTTTLFSQSKLQVDSAAIVDILYQRVNDDSPGIAVGIVKNGNIIYEHYVGYANLEHLVKINKDTRFNIASNAKQYTALCILKLAEQGKLSLEDDFRKYLPNVHPNIQDKITISNLITHTSGIRDYCDLLALTGKTWWKQFNDNEDVMELLSAQRDLNFQPGSEYGYSNSNYILLAEIVKKVTDQDFNDFAKAMFEELGMPNTHFLTRYSEVIPHRASPYGNWNHWYEEPTVTEVHGDGALFTTLRDQLQWEQIIQVNDGKYLPQKLVNKTQSPIENSIDNNYGYGLVFDPYRGFEHTYHDGVTGAYKASFLRFPTEQLSIVLLSNNRNVRADILATKIAHLFLGVEDRNITYPENPDKVEALADIQNVLGFYKNDKGTIMKITEKDGFLYREIYQREPVKLINEQGGLFEYETSEGLKMNFANIGQPNQSLTLYASYQKPSAYYKFSSRDLNTIDKNELNGRFYNDETDTEIILKFIKGNTYSLIKNGKERKSELVLEDYLRMMGVYHIKVIRDEENNVIGLNIKRDRIKNVIFSKT